jgi:hypothetical protein
MNYHKEMMMEIVKNWDAAQLQNYITGLEVRMADTHLLIKELKAYQRKRNRRKSTVDTGVRDGR